MTVIDLTIDEKRRERALRRVRERKIVIPTFTQMKDPSRIPVEGKAALHKIGLRGGGVRLGFARLPIDRYPARGDEPGALRVAGKDRWGGHRHTRQRVECQR